MAASKPKSAPRPSRITGKEDDLMANDARQIIRDEIVRRGYSFKMLAEALAEQHSGAPIESVQSLTNKVNRGRFSFAFFLRAARAMGVPTVKLALDYEPATSAE